MSGVRPRQPEHARAEIESSSITGAVHAPSSSVDFPPRAARV